MLDGDAGPRVTARIFALKNADPEEWRDKRDVELTGRNGGPVKTETRLDVSGLSESALREIAGLNADEG